MSTDGDEALVEALTAAMALAPGVYARNRRFELFARPEVQRARGRAALLRGVVAQLTRACEVSVERGVEGWVLGYALPKVRATRVVTLTDLELSTLRVLASRAKVEPFTASDGDRARVERALGRLLGADADPQLAARR